MMVADVLVPNRHRVISKHYAVSASTLTSHKWYYTTYIWHYSFNTLRPRRNRRHFADDIFKCIFLNENEWISLRISLKFVPKGPINNIPALVQIMAWRRSGDKTLPEAMVVRLYASLGLNELTHCGLVMPYGNIDLGRHWLRELLTNHQWGLVAFAWAQFYRKCSRYLFLGWVWKLLILCNLSPRDQWHRSWSTSAQVMTCCLMAPSHYPNQWLIYSLYSRDVWKSAKHPFLCYCPIRFLTAVTLDEFIMN